MWSLLSRSVGKHQVDEEGSQPDAQEGWDRYQGQVEILRLFHMQTWATFTLDMIRHD